MYKIKDRMTTPILILETKKRDIEGRTKTVETGASEQSWCVWKSFGGTQKETGSKTGGMTNTSISVYEDTATLQMRYTPNIKQGDYIKNLITNEVYSVISIPDDLNQMHQFIILKVKKVR